MAELHTSGGDGLYPLPGTAPSPEFLLVDEESSTYPLLTPSPTTGFDHPLALDTQPAYERQLSPSSIDTDLTLSSAAPPADYGACLPAAPVPHPDSEKVQDGRHSGLASSSSSSSVLQETTASAQLLNPHHYLGLSSDANCTENGGISSALCGITLGSNWNPTDFFFISWNWPLIRKCCFWGMMSLMVACICVVIGYITTLPARCDPPRAWYQGSLIYEIFPGSFHDSDGDGVGDLKGISAKVNYLESMGVRGVRLNSIFPSEHFPEHYYIVDNLTQIEHSLGTLTDFTHLVKTLHSKNISVILDLPLEPFLKQQNENTKQSQSHHVIINNHILNSNSNKTAYIPQGAYDTVPDVLEFWLHLGVDGFYLKDVETLSHDDQFQKHIHSWKSVLKKHNGGLEKILICSENVIKNLENSQVLSPKLTAVLANFDLVDCHVDMSGNLKGQIDAVQGGPLFRSPGYPWPMWTLGGVDTPRLASRLLAANASLAAVLVGMMLPGTPSVFYGDELGLDNVHDPDKDFADLSHAHHLVMMPWKSSLSHTLKWLPAPKAHLPVDSGRWLSAAAVLRDGSPSIYMHAIWKDGALVPNCVVKYVDKNLVVLERLYPRRHSYVVVANLGNDTERRDLSKVFYGGHVVLSTGEHLGKYVTFHKLSLYPGEAMFVMLDK